VKISQADPACTPTTLLNSGVTGPTFTKFILSVARSSQMNF